MKQVLIITIFIFFGYDNNSESINKNRIAQYGNISNINWQIESIVIKEGTDNPDEIVPENQITIIDTGSIIKGKIFLSSNKTVRIKESSSNFYFNNYDQYQWESEGNSFIRFNRYDSDGRLLRSSGFNVRFTNYDKMQWFIQGVAIESGQKRIKLITLYHN